MDEYSWDEMYLQGWRDEQSGTEFELIEEDFEDNQILWGAYLAGQEDYRESVR